MIRKRFASIALGLLILCAACTRGESFVPKIVPAGQYERIVSLTPSLTEILFALGAGDRVKGVTAWCNHPPEAAALPRVGDFLKPNMEAMLSIKPDLVVLAATGNLLRESYDNLLRFDFEVLVVWNNTIDETLAAVGEIGRVLELDQNAADLEKKIRRDLAAGRERFSSLRSQRILWVMGRKPIVAVGEGTFQNELIELVGGINVAEGMGAWPVLNTEFVLATDPDIIVDSAMGTARDDDHWKEFATLSAVRANRIFPLDSDLVYRPGPRMAEGLILFGQTLSGEISSR